MSRASNSEKYLICIDFISQNKDIDKKINNLENVLYQLIKEKNRYLVDIFPKFVIPNDFNITMINANTSISNQQLISINEIVDFIQKKNNK